MLWSRRQILLAAASLPLAGCGFRPLYGEGTAAQDLEGLISVPILPGRFGFDLRERLLNQLGIARAPRYSLEISTDIAQESRAILSDNTITRFTLTATASYAIIPLNAIDAVFQDTEQSITGYSTVASPFATRQAEADAFRRLAVSLAEKIVLKLASTAQDWADEA